MKRGERKKRRALSAFQHAVARTPGIAEVFQAGLGALIEADRNRVSCQDTRELTGSVHLDEALAESVAHRDKPRWDYGIGHRERVFWVEVHPASSHHVDSIIKKYEWLRSWLGEEAPNLDALPCDFVWLAAGAVSLPPGDRRRRLLAEKSIKFAGSHLRLDRPPEK